MSELANHKAYRSVYDTMREQWLASDPPPDTVAVNREDLWILLQACGYMAFPVDDVGTPPFSDFSSAPVMR